MIITLVGGFGLYAGSSVASDFAHKGETPLEIIENEEESKMTKRIIVYVVIFMLG